MLSPPFCHYASSKAAIRKSFCSVVTTAHRTDASRVRRLLVPIVLGTSIATLSVGAAHPAASARVQGRFEIPTQNLADALDRFGEQSGLQVVYAPQDLDAL